MLHGIKPTILLFEADTSLRRLIALGLQYRGMHVIEATSLTALSSLAAQQPGLVVLDIDGTAGSDQSFLTAAQAHPLLSTLPMVVLAWDCPLPAPADITMQPSSQQAQITCLSKPFDARTLHATIEQILLTSQAIAASKKQEVYPAPPSAHPAPSIWPLVTAAALLLVFIGLMIQIALTAVGLLIVVVALLLWTLDTRPEQKPLTSPTVS